MNTNKTHFDKAAVAVAWLLAAIVCYHERKLIMTIVCLFVLLFITWAILIQNDNNNQGGNNDGLV